MESDHRSSVGIDIGSRMTKVVRIQDGEITYVNIFDTGHEPLAEISRIMSDFSGDTVIATGYGRRLVQNHFPCRIVTEIRACARGVHFLHPGCTSVVDIGGQDTKAIELKENGGFGRFEMNDRCAAGTGRFFEVMAGALGFTVDDFGSEALEADRPVHVNSMCTVFAESEVVSLIARGENRRRIALGLHIATAKRVAAMVSRINSGSQVLFVGGVAKNPCIVSTLQEELPNGLIVPEKPELAVAIGAALIGLHERC